LAKEVDVKAAQIEEYGNVSRIKVVEIEVPTLGEGQILVEVHASSINPVDTAVREGYMKVAQLPATLGGDFAGVVSEVRGNSDFAVGDKVYGQASALMGASGAFAEYTATAAERVAPMPEVSFEQAASLPLVGVSALQALTDHIGLQSGQKLFIHGGAGGIGSIAIQIAKHLGAYVATTATGDGVAFVRQLGADKVIDYTSERFSDVLSGYDAVFDTVGGDDFAAALSILKSGRVAVSMTAHVDASVTQELGVTTTTQFTQVTTEKLTQLALLVNEGVVQPQVNAVFPLVEVRQAFEARESGRVKGKVVLAISQ
jgi:NADPH:quinone reductase-like Zn-dependent oxidoreductase